MRDALVEQRLGHEHLEKRLEHLVALEHEEVNPDLDVVKDEAHPGVVVGVLEAAEGLAEGQVADDVEGGEVVPLHDVERALAGDAVQALDEQVDVGLDDGLLVLHALGGEAMRQNAAVAGVVLAVGGDEVRVALVDEVGEFGVLLELAALAVAHDLLPGVRGLEGEEGRGEADNVAVAGVQGEDVLVRVAAEEHE